METTQQFQPTQQSSGKSLLPAVVISILVTALTVGLGVYFLQKVQIDRLKSSYENEIRQLKIQILNLEQTSQNTPTNNNQGVVDCGNSYDCLYSQVSGGNSAKVTISERINSLSLEEKSEVKVEPISNQFQVLMTVLELKKFEQTQPMTKSIVGSVSESCPQIVNNLSSIELTSASCTVNTAEEARTLAMDGLSDTAISKYSCKGKLVDEIKRICVRPDFPNFPPGVKKPAIYLYPLQKSKINVSVDLKGIITKSEPSYFKGWEVTAEPSGLIDGKFDYLFYEAQLEQLQLSKEGWVVGYKELENWFDSNLKKFGLNEKEISQFKEYWLAELPFARYYEIKLLEDSFLAENMNLIIDPKPTTVIRRNFYFKPLESKIYIEQPIVITPERKGFTVVEWGGLLDK
jgi:hypothetical protein